MSSDTTGAASYYNFPTGESATYKVNSLSPYATSCGVFTPALVFDRPIKPS